MIPILWHLKDISIYWRFVIVFLKLITMYILNFVFVVCVNVNTNTVNCCDC